MRILGKFLRDKEIAAYRESHTPDQCPILGIKEFKPVLDHCHDTGKVRGVLSNEANLWLGKVENFLKRCGSPLSKKEAIKNLALYLIAHSKAEEESPFHPEGLRQVVRRFKTKKVGEQKALLEELGISKKEISEAKNSTKRANLYRKYLRGEL